MKLVIFYEKPGCATNAKQKKSLRNAGCMLIVRSLLEHQMQREELLSYLEHRPVKEWFNPNAPALKKGIINPNLFNKEEALSLLFRDPILIRRPLMIVDGERMCGFDQARVEKLLNTKLSFGGQQSCHSTHTACATPVPSTSAQ